MWAFEQHATIDWETYSECGLRWDEEGQTWRPLPGAGTKKSIQAVGAAAYAEHPTTDILTLSYRLPHWPPGRVDRWRPGLPAPQELFDWIAAGGLVEAHNVMFERLVWFHVATPRYGFPAVPPRQWRCSMAKARVLSLPGALGDLTGVLGTTIQKDADGTRLLNKFSQPRKPTKADARLRITPVDDPEDGERLCRYCDTDVLSEEEASHAMLPMSHAELEFWQLDQEMNWRGIGVDIAGVNDMIAILEQALDKYGRECEAITGGLGPSQVQKLVGWLAAKGVSMASLDAEALEEALAREGLPADARRVLEIRSLVGSASVKKLYAMQRTTSRDGRVRNVIIHHGARTGRPTGDLVQPLNLPKAGPDLAWCDACCCPSTPRPVCPWCGTVQPPGARVYKWPDVPKALEGELPIDWVMPIMSSRSLEMVERYFGDALLTISGCVRGMLQADPGNELISSDYSAIEAVVTAALACCQWRLDAFAEGKDIYLMSASQRRGGLSYEEYQAHKAEHGTHHWHRQKWGKVFELACLGPQTQVLTERGWLAIVDVLTTDKLWDGFEWVTHGGLIDRGVKPTMLLDGVRITPDHLVNTNGSWREAGSISTNAFWWTQALATGSESLKRLAELSVGEMGNTLPKSGALVGQPPIGSPFTTCETESPLGATLAPRKRPELTEKCGSAMRKLCQMTSTAVVSLAGLLQPSRVATRPRLSSSPAMAGAEFASATSGEPISELFSGTFKPLRAGTTPILKWIDATRTGITNREISASSQKPRMAATSARSIKKTSRSSSSKASSLISMSVFDLANAGPRNRFTIKTASGAMIVHNCGFGGWIGAVRAFDTETPDNEVKEGILEFRRASPEIVEMWGGQERGRPWEPGYRLERFGFEGAFINAVQYPTQVFESNGIRFFMRGDACIVKLLSGRELTYHQPRLWPSTRDYVGQGVLEITYMTWNSNPKYGARGWGPMKTYAGRLCENIVQATAHDIQRYGILALEAAGYPVILHVYDEDVSEVPAGFGSVEEFEEIMRRMPPWAAGWPIKASGGWRGRRYRKA